MQTNHISILVRNLRATSAGLGGTCTLQPIEAQEYEGTIEQYVELGDEQAPSILLVEAVAPGPYRDALTKRGPGLHHIGVMTDTFDAAINHYTQLGLLLHPISERLRPKGIVWLYQRGMPLLIELMRSERAPPLRECRIALPMGTTLPVHLDHLAANLRFTTSTDTCLRITTAERTITINPHLT